MGRHTLPDERGFWRSVLFFALKWIGVVALPVLAIWGIWRLARGPDEPPSPAAVTSPSPSPPPSPIPSPEPSPSPELSPSPSPSPPPRASGRLQVLNGSSTPGRGQQAAQQLREAGFEIVAVQQAARRYDRTTVFFQPGFRPMAEQAAQVVGATVIEPAPSNLDRDIPVTVVVGEDYP